MAIKKRKQKIKWGTKANGSNLKPKNLNWFSLPLKDPNGAPRPIVTADYYQTFLYCPSVLYYSKGEGTPLNPYEIYCRFILEESMKENNLKPSVVFAKHVNLFEEFERNGKFYDRVWLITKGLYNFEQLLKRLWFSYKSIVGYHKFRKKGGRLDIDIDISSVLIDEKKRIFGLTFSPFKTAHEIAWNPIHIWQYQEIRRLQKEIGYSRNLPNLYVLYTDEMMQWKNITIKSFFRTLEKERMLMQMSTMTDINIIHNYIAPKLVCPNLDCPFVDECMPNSSNNHKKLIEKDIKYSKGKLNV